MNPTEAGTTTAIRKVVVGIADLKHSQDVGECLITYALGSCLGVTVYDPVAHVAGMLHLMMPDSTIDAASAAANPYKFVDTGVPLLFKKAYELGAKKERLIIKVAGGANPLGGNGEDYFQIGRRNMTALRKLLFRNGVLIKAEDTGGMGSRTMSIDVASGAVTLKMNEGDRPL
jgi:chemotaxis protein CheD